MDKAAKFLAILKITQDLVNPDKFKWAHPECVKEQQGSRNATDIPLSWFVLS